MVFPRRTERYPLSLIAVPHRKRASGGHGDFLLRFAAAICVLTLPFTLSGRSGFEPEASYRRRDEIVPATSRVGCRWFRVLRPGFKTHYSEPEGEGCSAVFDREVGVGASVVADCDATSVLELGEQVVDLVALAVEGVSRAKVSCGSWMRGYTARWYELPVPRGTRHYGNLDRGRGVRPAAKHRA